MSSYTIMYVCLLLLLTSFIAVEWRNLKASVYTYMLNSVLMALIFVLYANELNNHAIYYWAVTVIVSKGIIIPWLLRRYATQIHAVEAPAAVNPMLSQVFAVAVAAVAFGWVFIRHDDFVIEPSLAGEPFRINLAVAAAILVIGFYSLITRKDAFKIVLGLCLLENAVHLSLVSLAPSVPESAMIGVVTDVVVSVWMMLFVVSGIYRTVGSTDTVHLSQLRG